MKTAFEMRVRQAQQDIASSERFPGVQTSFVATIVARYLTRIHLTPTRLRARCASAFPANFKSENPLLSKLCFAKCLAKSESQIVRDLCFQMLPSQHTFEHKNWPKHQSEDAVLVVAHVS